MILQKAFTYAMCGSAAAVAARFLGRKNPGPRYEQAAAIGALVGAGFGAFFGILQAMLIR